MSHSDRREGGEFYFFVHAIFTFYAYHSLSCFLFFVLSLCFRTSASLSRETQTQLKFGYSRSRVCSGIILRSLLDGCVDVDGWMDASSRVVLEWWTMSLMEWVVKTEKPARQQSLLLLR